MTEQEFMRQVWRPYDTVEIDGGIKGHVVCVAFPSRSVKVTITKEVYEWFRCDMIIKHTSASGAVDDISIIEELHNKLMNANKRNDDLQAILNIANEKNKQLNVKLNTKSETCELKKLRKAVESINSTMGSINHRVQQIDEYLTSVGITDEESN